MPFFFKFRDCLESELDSQSFISGTFIVTRDAGNLYCDTLAGDRLPLGQVVHVVTGSISSILYPESGHFYYSTTDKNVCFYSDGTFQPINMTVGYIDYKNIRVPAAGSASVAINTGYSGRIMSVAALKLDTDISIYDLDATQFVGAGKVRANTAVNTNGSWSIPLVNENANYDWLGGITAVIVQRTALPS